MNLNPKNMADTGRLRTGLLALVAVQAVGYAVIAWLSQAFAHDQGFGERPLLAVLGLFGVCFACSVASGVVAVRLGEGRWLAGVIVAAALVFRGLLLWTPPIQEVDIYRYVWDGAVASQGVSPYRYPPAAVLAAHDGPATDAGGTSPELARLVGLLDASPGLADALRRVHYPELTTIYPPVSQAVFTVTAMLTPLDASVFTRITIMKIALLVFDMATVGMVFWLLRAAGRHMGLAIVYAWCPLVIKEFANSGHLDSIAVCLTMASVCSAARLWCRCGPHAGRWGIASAVLLGLAVGAKIYPVILVPLVTVVTMRKAGLRHGSVACAAAILTSIACLAPMVWPTPGGDPPGASDPPGTSTGLAAFVSRWEINDLVFMVVLENLRPVDPEAHAATAWFAIVPNAWRWSAIGPLAGRLGVDTDRAAFWATRGLTGLVFFLVLLPLLFRVAREPSLPRFLEAAFLTIAWFWLLAPTQNPWYWTWAVPLVPLARGRAWQAVSGLVFLSYLRFWLVYHYPEASVFGTGYGGGQFFDFFVPWVEFGPWFLWLASGAILRRNPVTPTETDGDSLCGQVHRDAGALPL